MAETRRRILILWFPHLGAEHALRRTCVPPGAPFALVEELCAVPTIASTEAEARRMGVRPGQGLCDALAVCGALVTRPRDPAAEEAAMAALARWAGRFTPWVAPWEAARTAAQSAALALDVTGCAHLHGGEERLADAVLEGCTAMRLTARIGLADTPGAAWALARHAPNTGTGTGTGADTGTGAGAAPRIAGRRSRRSHAGDVAQHIGDAGLLRRAGDAPEAACEPMDARARGRPRPPRRTFGTTPDPEPGPPPAPSGRPAPAGAEPPDAAAPAPPRSHADRAVAAPHPARRALAMDATCLRPCPNGRPRDASTRHASPPASGLEHGASDPRRPGGASSRTPPPNGRPRHAVDAAGVSPPAPGAPFADALPLPSADAIDQEAPATRARASRRARIAARPSTPGVAIAPSGRTHEALAPLPVAALRIDEETVAALSRVGLRRVADLVAMPRAALTRRFGAAPGRRLDQALGSEPEPISPAAPPPRLAVRLTFPEPIGREEDMLAALDRLLPALSTRLGEHGLAARRVRLEALCSEGCARRVEVGLARPSADPDRIRPLLAMKLSEIEAGFGIDALRVEAVSSERAERGDVAGASGRARHRASTGRPAAPPGAGARAEGGTRRTPGGGSGRPSEASPRDVAFHDLVGRIGARFGLEAIWRVHPAESHIPEKDHRTTYVAWSDAHPHWPATGPDRPLLLWPPEALSDASAAPARFRWRGRTLDAARVSEPERIAPEWWLDDPAWRSGVRDYRRVATTGGEALWLFYAHGGRAGPGWFCQGAFA